jgi:hypothetical protein
MSVMQQSSRSLEPDRNKSKSCLVGVGIASMAAAFTANGLGG